MNAELAEPSCVNHGLAPCPSDPALLLVGVAAGEQRALERFYRLTVDRVFAAALRIVRCHGTAEEVAEDVYLQIWHSASRFDCQRGSPLAWALTICRSRAIDALRRVDNAIVDAEPTERPDAAVQHLPALHDLLQAAQDNAALHVAFAKLKPEQRQVLCLSFFRGLTHAEIAAASQLPLGTVKSHIRRALCTLRAELGAA